MEEEALQKRRVRVRFSEIAHKNIVANTFFEATLSPTTPPRLCGGLIDLYLFQDEHSHYCIASLPRLRFKEFLNHLNEAARDKRAVRAQLAVETIDIDGRPTKVVLAVPGFQPSKKKRKKGGRIKKCTVLSGTPLFGES